MGKVFSIGGTAQERASTQIDLSHGWFWVAAFRGCEVETSTFQKTATCGAFDSINRFNEFKSACVGTLPDIRTAPNRLKASLFGCQQSVGPATNCEVA